MKEAVMKRKRHINWRSQMEVQSMVLPAIIFCTIFCYIPMLFTMISFQDYNLIKGIWESEWVGLKHFKELFVDSSFLRVLRNTFGINLLGLVIGFPIPIIFAFLLNELHLKKLAKLVQTSTYIPYFFSWAVFGGIVLNFLSPSMGAFNQILYKLGIIQDKINFIGEPKYFWSVAIISGLVKEMGYQAIIYIAAIAGVDPSYYEAAKVDGANRFQIIWYITLPSITGTILIMLIFKIAGIMNTGLEQILILQNIMNLSASETLDTYVYKLGMQQMNFSYGAAVGLFKSLVAVVLLGLANLVSKKLTNKGLF